MVDFFKIDNQDHDKQDLISMIQTVQRNWLKAEQYMVKGPK